MINQLKNNKRDSFLLLPFLTLTCFLTLKTFKTVNIHDLRISGSEIITKEDIVKNSSLNLPSRLIFTPTKLAEKELKNNLSLQNISITKQLFPFRLNILIQTRKPVAYGERFINEKKIIGFIDKDGVFIDEKYSDKKNIERITIKVVGWEEKFRKILSEILSSQKLYEIELVAISFSKNGFLTLEEKELKTILLGFNQNLIKKQLLIISKLKKQLSQKNIIEKIDNIDLTDPINPKIKVFKP